MSDYTGTSAMMAPAGPTATAPPPTGTDQPLFTTKERTQTQLVIRRFLRHRLAVASLFMFLLIVAFAFLGPMLWKYDHTYILGPPNVPWFSDLEYPLGTDQAGHDLLGQVIRGTQQSMKISLLVAVMAATVGALWGAVAGFFRGWVDNVMMRFVDVLLTLPAIAVAIALAANIRSGANWFGIALVLAFLSWPLISRVVRGVVLSLREQEFVEAARAMGASDARIILRHLVPNALGPVIVAATIAIAAAILAETALSFIGFGVQKPDTSLGLLITGASGAVFTRPWLFYVPGAFIILIALTINFIGDGLRDAFDPRQTMVRR